MIKRISAWTICTGLVLGTLTACSGLKTDNVADPAKPGEKVSVKGIDEPATIFMYSVDATKTETFDLLWGDRLRKKFPKLTVEFLQESKGNTIQDLAARKQIPDIIRVGFNTLREDYLDIGLGYDMRPIVEKHKYDLAKFEPSLMTRIVNEAPNGELFGLPITGSTNSLAMFYNKDIFDKFGLPYPTDSMTWDDVYELAKKIGRTEGGVVYKGFTGLTPNILRYNQLGLPFIDPNADKIYDTEKWKAVFNNFLRFYELPNNPFGETLTDHYNDFGKKLNVAMHLSNHGDYRSFPDKMNWDIMAIPAMKGIAPNSGGVGAAYWAITQQAPDKELAFRVISYLLSEEVQIANARLGYIPSVVDQKIFDSFGLDDPKLQGKNRKAFFAHPYAPAPAKRNPSLIRFNESDQANIFRDVLANVAQNKTDINTALREATEQIDKKFKEAAAK